MIPENTILCAFCGENPIDRSFPDWLDRAAAHVLTCPKHPLAPVLASRNELLAAARMALQQFQAQRDGGRMLRRETVIAAMERVIERAKVVGA